MAQNNVMRRKSESGGGLGGGGLGRYGLGQKRKRDRDRNPGVEPSMRVMDRFWEYLSHTNRDGITFPKGVDVR